MNKELSKYAAKKARQAETGEVGYLTCAMSGEIMVAVPPVKPPKVRLTPAEQSAKDKAANAASTSVDHKIVSQAMAEFATKLDDANGILDDIQSNLTTAVLKSHGRVYGEVNAINGLFGVAIEKVKSALSRTVALVAVLEGDKV